MSDFNFSPSWIISLSQSTTVDHFTFADTITGLILSDLIATIEHHTTTTSHTISIINKVFYFMFTKLYHEMWIPRCSQLSLVEKPLVSTLTIKDPNIISLFTEILNSHITNDLLRPNGLIGALMHLNSAFHGKIILICLNFSALSLSSLIFH